MVKGTSLLTHATPLHPLFSIAKKKGERETKEKQSFKVARNYQKAVTKVKMIGTVLDILVRLEFKKKKNCQSTIYGRHSGRQYYSIMSPACIVKSISLALFQQAVFVI